MFPSGVGNDHWGPPSLLVDEEVPPPKVLHYLLADLSPRGLVEEEDGSWPVDTSCLPNFQLSAYVAGVRESLRSALQSKARSGLVE